MGNPSFGYPPIRMRAKQAAWYLGVSESEFRRKVSQHFYPQPVAEGEMRFWLRSELEEFVVRSHNLGQSVKPDLSEKIRGYKAS